MPIFNRLLTTTFDINCDRKKKYFLEKKIFFVQKKYFLVKKSNIGGMNV